MKNKNFDLKKYLKEKGKSVEKLLKKYLPKDNSVISQAMRYSVLAGGKRLRPIFVMLGAESFGLNTKKIESAICAVEFLHTYSLIHDDLPAMDNDDLRRGKPTNHKVFGEACAVLAGDALISFGAQLILEELEIEPEIKLEIINDYLKCAGAFGIIAGQIADIEAEKKEIDLENLKYIHKYKTGALFEFAMVSAGKLAKISSEKLSLIKEYANNFGILFQIYDDIIDCTLSTEEIGKTAGKDANSNKLTYISAYGLKEAKNIFYSLIDKNHAILTKLDIQMDIFDEIYNMLDKRIKNGAV